MTPERARELLGGLSTGILTPEERQVLFEAALHDQAIFNEVADELEFAAFLQSPETRAQLANRIEVEPERGRWWALRPRWLALSGVLAASAVLTVVLWHRPGEATREPVVVTTPAPPPIAAPAGVNGARPGDALQNKTETASARPATHQRLKEAAQAMSGQAAHEGKQEAAPADKDTAAEFKKATPSPAAPAPEQRAMAVGGPTVPAPAAPKPAPPPTPQAAASAFRATPMRAAAPPPTAPPPPAAASGAIAGFAGTRSTASLEGTVHDASGAAVKNAAIDIVNNATNTTTHAVSDADGRFVAPPLAPGGPYTVTAAAPGFKKEERTGITLAVNQPARIDIPLQVGSMSQTVEIMASANSLQVNQFNATRQVAVLDFVNGASHGQSGQHAGQQAADLLSSQLDDSGQVRVIDREKVQQAQQAQAQSRPPSAKQAADLGRRLGADAVIVGTVKAPATGNSNVAVTAQVIDTKKARAMSKVAANGASLQGATNILGLALESQLALPMEGAVTSVEQNTVSVTFKPPATPQIGAQFDVYRGKRKIGLLTLTSAYGQSAAGTFSGTGQPHAGDRVATSR